MSLALLALRRFPSWVWLIPACAALAIAEMSQWIDIPEVGGGFKPLTTLLIIVHAASMPNADARRRRWVLLALCCAFLGDCAMASPATFVLSVFFFAMAQCACLAMLSRTVGLSRPGIWLGLHAVAVAWAMAMWSVKPWPTFGPIAVFLGLLGLMSAQADAWWWRVRGTPEAAAARAAALGGLLWLLADLVWTYSQHVQRIPDAPAFTLALYWLALWQLASAIGAGSKAPAA